jgi:hypothetical protein
MHRQMQLQILLGLETLGEQRMLAQAAELPPRYGCRPVAGAAAI